MNWKPASSREEKRCALIVMFSSLRGNSQGTKTVSIKMLYIWLFRHCCPLLSLKIHTAWLHWNVFLPTELQASVTSSSINDLRAQVVRSKAHVEAGRFPVNIDSVSKCLYTIRDYWDRCLRGPLYLLLKVLTVPSSEAFMETLGSIMEKLHKRFNHSEASKGRCL